MVLVTRCLCTNLWPHTLCSLDLLRAEPCEHPTDILNLASYRSARGRNNCKRACVCYNMQKNLQREIDSSFLLHDWLSTRTQMTADQVKVEDFKLHRCINYLLRPFCEPLLDISLALMTDLMIVAIGNECEYPPRHLVLLLLSRLNLLQNRSDTIL